MSCVHHRRCQWHGANESECSECRVRHPGASGWSKGDPEPGRLGLGPTIRPIVRNPDAEERYLGSVSNLVDSFDYDGIDLDWEYPDTTEEIAGFDRLSKRFRKQLDGLALKKHRPMFQTMAAAASTNTLKWLSNDLLLATMDWVNVMTYDMAGEWTDYAGHHAPLFASSKQPGRPRSAALSIQYLLERGMPANRLALGIPLYGKGFFAAEPYASTKDTKDKQGAGRPPGGNYTKLVQLQKEQGWSRRWDNETKNPWLLSADRSAVIGYDDPESVALKTEWAMKQGLRGVFFWEIAADRIPDGTNPLQESSRRKLD